jgi:hypothetical protein
MLMVIGTVFYINLTKHLYSKRLLLTEINALIVKIEYHNRGGYKYYYDSTASFGCQYFNMSRDSSDLVVGDSISKSSNSLELKVYRKDLNRSFKYIATFEGD